MKVIAYLLYGDDKKYELEALFSILSVLRFLNNTNDEIPISIISDSYREFVCHLPSKQPIEQIIYSQAELAEWTQGGAYRHRIKPCALIKALDYYRMPVILVDTDTYFVDHPVRLIERVTPERSVMHQFEYLIADEPHWRSIVAKLGDGMQYDGINLSRQSPMFNSGVIGIDYSNRSLLDKSLNLLDTLHTWSPIFNIEQFAMGAVLNQHTSLSLSDDIVKHYWGYEREFIHIQIARRFQGATKGELNFLLNDPSTFEVGYPAKAIADKTLSFFMGLIQRWDHRYRFAYLAYRSALFYASKDTGYANIWSNIALQEVSFVIKKYQQSQKMTHPLMGIQRDFYQFRTDSIKSLDWLNSDIKNRWILFWEQYSLP